MKNCKYVYIDRDGCGKAAFYLKEKTNFNGIVLPDSVILLNGKQPSYGDMITCGTCNNPILGLMTSSNIEEIKLLDINSEEKTPYYYDCHADKVVAKDKPFNEHTIECYYSVNGGPIKKYPDNTADDQDILEFFKSRLETLGLRLF